MDLNLNKQIVPGALLIMILSLASCQGIDSQHVPIKIGWIGPLTGPAAVLGVDSLVAAQMAVDEINAAGGIYGMQLQLVVEDDQYITSKTLTSYERLVHVEGVSAIVMVTYGSVFALAEQATKDGVIIIDPLDCDRPMAGLGENIFCIAPSTEDKANVIVEAARELNLGRLGALVNTGDPFMPQVDQFLKIGLESHNITLISSRYDSSTRDFKTEILRFMDEHVEGIVFLGYDEMGLAQKQARAMGFEGQFFSTGTVTSPGWLASAGQDSDGTYYGFWEATYDSLPRKHFLEKFNSIQSRDPFIEFETAGTYDAVHVLAGALSKSEGDKIRPVASRLLEIRDYHGASGMITMQPDGSAWLPLSLRQLKDGKSVPVDW